MNLTKTAVTTVVRTALMLAAAAQASAQQCYTFPEPPQSPTDEYFVLDDTVAEWTNLNLPVTHGLLVHQTVIPEPPPEDPTVINALFAVNVHANYVALFVNKVTPTKIFPTPNGPVALAHLEREPDPPTYAAAQQDDSGFYDDELLVVCRGSNCLVRLDVDNEGAVLGLLRLPAEPADIVVNADETRAYVSCAGPDEVVEIDLDPSSNRFFTITDTYEIDNKKPTWLSIDGTDVYVSALISGNGTRIQPNNAFLGENVEVNTAIADEDFFRIDTTNDTVSVILTGLGATNAGHAVHRVDANNGHIWIATTQLLNATSNTFGMDDETLSEAELESDFAINEIFQFDFGTSQSAAEDLNSTASSPPDYSDVSASEPMVASPWGVTVNSNGDAFVTGLTTDTVAVVDKTDLSRIATLVCPDGSIPRYVALLEDTVVPVAYVYCWGTNKVELFDATATGLVSPFLSLEIGWDPTPETVRKGRRIFYDSSFSDDDNETCNTCHVEGGADMLGWNLSDLPRDNKGAMVTQSLFNLLETGPYHWRGERPLLENFNGPFDGGSAFHGLLGNSGTLSTEDFEDFSAFVFSLRTPANHKQSIDRRLHDTPLPGNPVQGQLDYLIAETGDEDLPDENPPIDPGPPPAISCHDCHALPTGTNGDIVADSQSWFAVRTNLEVTQLYNGTLTLKDQVVKNGFPSTGSGLIHKGSIATLTEFVEDSGAFTSLTMSQEDDIVAFLEVLDFGMSPGAHAAWLLEKPDPADPSGMAKFNAVVAEIESVLAQADQTQTDPPAIPGVGMVIAPATNVGPRWFYDPPTDEFAPDVRDPSGSSYEPLTFFTNDVMQNDTKYVVYGTPPGNDYAFGVDFDNDGLMNGDEALLGTDPWNPDVDGDLDPDGYEYYNPGGQAPIDEV